MAWFRRKITDPTQSLMRIQRIIQEGDLPEALEMLEDLHRRCEPASRAEVDRTMEVTRERLVSDLLDRSESCDDPREAASLLDAARDWAEGHADLERRIRAKQPAAPVPSKDVEAPERIAEPPDDDDETEFDAELPADLEEAAFELLMANADEDERAEYERAGDDFAAAYGAIQRGAYPEAAAMLRELAQRFPEAAHFRFHLANAEAAAGNWTEAARGFASFLQDRRNAGFSPTLWSAYLGLSECLESGGNPDDARAALERCVESYPDEASPRLTLASLLRRQDRCADALDHLDRLKQDPEVREVADLRIAVARESGLCLAALRRWEAGRAELQRYVEQASSRKRGDFWDGDVMAVIAQASEELGEREAAGKIFAELASHARSEEERRGWLSKIPPGDSGPAD
jgi:TolA-binding protein